MRKEKQRIFKENQQTKHIGIKGITPFEGEPLEIIIERATLTGEGIETKIPPVYLNDYSEGCDIRADKWNIAIKEKNEIDAAEYAKAEKIRLEQIALDNAEANKNQTTEGNNTTTPAKE